MTEVTATEFRRNLFSLLDQASETGEGIVVRRRGKRFVVRAEPEPDPPLDRWVRYSAWIDERRARGELPAEPAEETGPTPAPAPGDWRPEWEAKWKRFFEELDTAEPQA